MLINFAVLKDFKKSEKWSVLISSISKGEISFSGEIKKLKSYNLYTSDINHRKGKKVRAIWTKIHRDAEDLLVLLDVVKEKYERSRYFNREAILEEFFQSGDSITKKITSDFFEESSHKLGSEVDHPFYFLHKKVIKLSVRQEEILQKHFFPGFYILNGIAGSGKTSISYLKLKNLCKNGGSYLFTTSSRYLSESLERMFIEEEVEGKVVFFGYEDLVRSYFPSTKSLKKVGYAQFKAYIKENANKSGLSVKMLYSLMQYIAIKPDIVPGKRYFFRQISDEEFRDCCKLYYRYALYLEKNREIDLSLAGLKPEKQKVFDFIIVDETQDLSPREIENICLLGKYGEGVVMFNIDSNQHSYISLPLNYLKSHEYTKEVIDILDSSFRTPKDVLKYAQSIVDVRSFVLKGVPDKHIIRDFTSSNTNDGNIVHIGVREALRLYDNVGIAALAFDNAEKLEVEQLLSNISQIFTVDEVKGLEYDTVVVFNPYEKFSETLAKDHQILFEKTEVNTCLPKDLKSVNHEVKILFNQFFTAVTRTTNNLYILEKCAEKSSKQCRLFKRYLTKDMKEGKIYIVDESTEEEWIKQIHGLALYGFIHHAVAAYKKRNFSIRRMKKLYPSLLTYKICLIAVLANVLDLQHIPEQHLGFHFYNYILLYKNFKDIPEFLKTEVFCSAAVNMNIENIQYVPSVYKDVYRFVLERFEYHLYEIPKNLISSSICCIALENDVQSNFFHIPQKFEQEVYMTVLKEKYGCSLENFPPTCLNLPLVEIAVKLSTCNLQYLTEPLLTKNVCSIALSNYNRCLKGFPMELMSHYLAETAVALDVHNLRYLSKCFLTEVVYKTALSTKNNSLENFPKELVDMEIAKTAVCLDAKNLLYLENRFLKRDIFEAALSPYKNSIQSFPRLLIDRFKMLSLISVQFDPYNLKYYPFNRSLQTLTVESITPRIAQVAVELDPHNLRFPPYNCSIENFPKELMSLRIAQVAVKIQPHNLKYYPYNSSLENFPRHLITQKIAEKAAELNASNLIIIRKELKSDRHLNMDSVCTAALQCYKNSLINFPKNLIDEDLLRMAVKLNILNVKLLDVQQKTVKVYMAAVGASYAKSLKFFFQKLPDEKLNDFLAEAAVTINPRNLIYISSNFVTEYLYRAMLKPYQNSLRRFPPELVNQQIFEVALNLNSYNIQYVNDFGIHIDRQACYTAFFLKHNNSLETVPDELIETALVSFAVMLNAENFRFVPEVCISENLLVQILGYYENSLEPFPTDANFFYRIAQVAVKLNIENFRFVPEWCLTDSFLERILSFSNNSLEFFPVDACGFYLVAEVAVKLNIENVQYLPEVEHELPAFFNELFPNFLSIL